jgi:hypothetical protein
MGNLMCRQTTNTTASSEMLPRVVWQTPTDVSEELTVSISRMIFLSNGFYVLTVTNTSTALSFDIMSDIFNAVETRIIENYAKSRSLIH